MGKKKFGKKKKRSPFWAHASYRTRQTFIPGTKTLQGVGWMVGRPGGTIVAIGLLVAVGFAVAVGLGQAVMPVCSMLWQYLSFARHVQDGLNEHSVAIVLVHTRRA